MAHISGIIREVLTCLARTRRWCTNTIEFDDNLLKGSSPQLRLKGLYRGLQAHTITYMNTNQSTPKLTRKQAAFVKELIDNPKKSATEAAARTYDVANRQTAEVIAYENLRKPQIISELSKHNDMIESALVNTVNDWKQEDNSRKREIAMDTAKFIHDKTHGKATQQIQIDKRAVVINISMQSDQQV